jgi:hypothetical protein
MGVAPKPGMHAAVRKRCRYATALDGAHHQPGFERGSGSTRGPTESSPERPHADRAGPDPRWVPDGSRNRTRARRCAAAIGLRFRSVTRIPDPAHVTAAPHRVARERSSGNGGEATEYFATLSRETERLHRMVEGLLEFGQMEAGKRNYEFAAADPVQLVELWSQTFRAKSPRPADASNLVRTDSHQAAPGSRRS